MQIKGKYGSCLQSPETFRHYQTSIVGTLADTPTPIFDGTLGNAEPGCQLSLRQTCFSADIFHTHMRNIPNILQVNSSRYLHIS